MAVQVQRGASESEAEHRSFPLTQLANSQRTTPVFEELVGLDIEAATETAAIERAVVLFSLDDERRKRLAVNLRR